MRPTLLLLLAACGSAPTPPTASASPEPAPAAAPAAPAPAAAPAPDVAEPEPGRPPTPSPSIDLAMAGRAANAWAKLVESGCDPTRGPVPVWTPVEARILRNVPYAFRGYQFSSDELTQFFAADGRSWYEGHTRDVVLPEAAKACVDTLKAREDALRAGWPIQGAREARVTTPEIFEALQAWGTLGDGTSPYGAWKLVEQPDGGWAIMAREPACTPDADECATFMVECYSEGSCHAVAAG